MIATLKHFGIHGASEGGLNVAPSFVDERTAREVFFQPFEACVKQAGALGLMPCYNEWSGIPAHSNQWLLTELLRKEWGFKGLVVSDYNAVQDLETLHKIAGMAAKFRLGLFENPYTDAEEAKRVIGCDANRKLAYRAASEAMVLLKNEGNILP